MGEDCTRDLQEKVTTTLKFAQSRIFLSVSILQNDLNILAKIKMISIWKYLYMSTYCVLECVHLHIYTCTCVHVCTCIYKDTCVQNLDKEQTISANKQLISELKAMSHLHQQCGKHFGDTVLESIPITDQQNQLLP